MLSSTSALLKNRAVIVTGARTPFVKSHGVFQRIDTVALGCAAVDGLIKKTKLDANEIDHIIWGNVMLQGSAHNCAREIVMDLNLPRKITGHLTSMACASGLNAVAQAVMMVETGNADVVIAGGSESCSNTEVPLPRSVMYGLNAMKKGGFPAFAAEAGTDVRGWLPVPSGGDRLTGKSMGYYGDETGRIYNVTRAEQEEFTLRSHTLANAAEQKGLFKDEIISMTVDLKGKKVEISQDDILQRDVEKMRAKLPSLKPCFTKDGSITPATSTALTDGASAVLVMSEEKAKALGYPTDVSLRSFHFQGIDPYPALLLAPVLGWGPLLKKAGLSVKDIGRYEIHEAFAVQTLATLKLLQSPEFFEQYTGKKEAFLKEPLDMNRLNVNGSSLAFGHPFAATGSRIVTSLANELRRSGEQYGLISICAAGGLGGLGVLEYTPKK